MTDNANERIARLEEKISGIVKRVARIETGILGILIGLAGLYLRSQGLLP
jgi:hypothetical protein